MVINIHKETFKDTVCEGDYYGVINFKCFVKSNTAMPLFVVFFNSEPDEKDFHAAHSAHRIDPHTRFETNIDSRWFDSKLPIKMAIAVSNGKYFVNFIPDADDTISWDASYCTPLID